MKGGARCPAFFTGMFCDLTEYVLIVNVCLPRTVDNVLERKLTVPTKML